MTISLFHVLVATCVAFVVGAALGYIVGWNRAAHPGKVEAQLSDAVDRAKKAIE
jgi:hypothetical protein